MVRIQDESEEIIHHPDWETGSIFSRGVSSFADLMETFVAQETGDESIAAAFRKRFDGVFGKEDAVTRTIAPGPFVLERLKSLRPLFAHRSIRIRHRIIAAPLIRMPSEYLRKTVDGLLKNAVENTPDQGRILVIVRPEGKGVRLEIRDYGIGLTEEARRRIFEGFYSNRDMQNYSSRRPFDFYAGGQGIDLLRTRIFSERYRFKIRVRSERCRHIPTEKDICPGKISLCRFCRSPEDCFASGHTSLILLFPESSV